MRHISTEEKEPRVVTSDSTLIRDWSGLEAEVQQSLRASVLAIDVLNHVQSSLEVSVQVLSEQSSPQQEYR